MKTRASTTVLTAALFAVALSACQKEAAEEQAATGSSETTTAAVDQLPLSINATMVALTDQSSDYIFAPGNGDMPKTDHHWAQVRNAAYDMILAGKVIQIPGTGASDAQWVGQPEWKTFADELTKRGEEALQLAEAKSTDQARWMATGDGLVQACLGCHEKFKPDTPSQGILHEATSRESLGESIFT